MLVLMFDKTSYRSQWFVSLWFGIVVSIVFKLILISCHNLLAILVKGSCMLQVYFLIFTGGSSGDVRPLTPGLGPSQFGIRATGLLVYDLSIGLG